MRAAQIAELGAPPTVVDLERGGSVEVLAVALNPLDLAVAAGRFYGGHPPLPYVPGCEAVGRRDGERVFMFGNGFGTGRDGFLVERVDFPAASAIPLPERIDDEHAVVCGIAGIAGWGAVAHCAPVEAGDRVLVLAATGLVGSIAVQGALLLGAERVVAAGRSPDALRRALELGADATVRLDEGGDLAERFREACGGNGPTHVVDPLWGEPAQAAVKAAAPRARIVQLGQSAGPEATLASADIRGKRLAILGHSVFTLPPEEFRAAYVELAEHVGAGRIRVDVETFALDDVAAAWSAQAAGRKAVVRL